MPVVEMFFKNAQTGKTVAVSVDSSTTVGAIKGKIEEQESIPAATQRLIFAGRVRASLSAILFASSHPLTDRPSNGCTCPGA